MRILHAPLARALTALCHQKNTNAIVVAAEQADSRDPTIKPNHNNRRGTTNLQGVIISGDTIMHDAITSRHMDHYSAMFAQLCKGGKFLMQHTSDAVPESHEPQHSRTV